jgi:hypothetical protein
MNRSQHPGGIVDRLNVFFEYRSYGVMLPRPVQPSRFAALAKAAAAPRPRDSRPDIFLVLEESTFDTRVLRGCPPEFCDPAMLHAPASATRTLQGPMLVHTTGGGTVLSEFAVLTGLDWRAFGRGGAYAPISLAPRLHDSLVLRLRGLGYRTIAIYPTDGEFLSARSAYRFYGFDEFHDADQLGLPSDWSEVGDAAVFEKALAAVAHGTDRRPVFIFALTIRNHGPHGAAANAVPAGFADAAASTSFAISDYLARLHASSAAYSALAEQWLAASRPRVIGWFGDHQPEAAWDLTGTVTGFDPVRLPANVGHAEQLYLTYYQMSANFGPRGDETRPEALDIAHLGATLLSFARLPLDPGATAALQVAAACHGLMLECADQSLVQDYVAFRVRELRALD